MSDFIVYKDDTGEILRTGVCPENMIAAQAESNETAIEGKANDELQYIDTNNVTDKLDSTAVINKTNMLADGIDTTVISNIPIGTMLNIENNEYLITDGVFEFTVDLPGNYTVTLTIIPYLPIVFEVIAI